MKTEIFYGLENTYTTVEELIQAMHDYIRYFNNDRIKVRLKGLTPIEYRTQALLTCWSSSRLARLREPTAVTGQKSVPGNRGRTAVFSFSDAETSSTLYGSL